MQTNKLIFIFTLCYQVIESWNVLRLTGDTLIIREDNGSVFTFLKAKVHALIKSVKTDVIVEKIGYDKEGHTVYTRLGNGTESTYTYDDKRERLQDMTLTAGGSAIMQNKYQYDAVDNILGFTNDTNPQSLTEMNKFKLGGA